jgi:hypothetical protein
METNKLRSQKELLYLRLPKNITKICVGQFIDGFIHIRRLTGYPRKAKSSTEINRVYEQLIFKHYHSTMEQIPIIV